MPYLSCPDCTLTIFSAASHSTRDRCPRCDSVLPAAADSRERRVRLLRTTAQLQRRLDRVADSKPAA